MFSWEIDNYIKNHNYSLTKDEYVLMIDVNKASQIISIKYNPFENNFKVVTNDGFEWIITIKNNHIE